MFLFSIPFSKEELKFFFVSKLKKKKSNVPKEKRIWLREITQGPVSPKLYRRKAVIIQQHTELGVAQAIATLALKRQIWSLNENVSY